MHIIVLMNTLPDTPIPQVAAGVLSTLLLLYPISTKPVHPILQIAICMSLTITGMTLFVSYIVADSWSAWCTAAVVILSLTNVIMPVIGSIIGLGTAMGLVSHLVCIHLFSEELTHWIVAGFVVAGMSLLFAWKSMFIYWQLIAPPIVGGYLAAITVGGEYSLIIWAVTTVASLGLHARKFFAHSWLDKKKDAAVNGNESRITKAMRSANPNMTVDEFEKLKIKLLEAVDGDAEQVDRVVYGGGLY